MQVIVTAREQQGRLFVTWGTEQSITGINCREDARKRILMVVRMNGQLGRGKVPT